MQQLLEQPQVETNAQDPQPAFVRRLAVSILRLAIVVVIAAVIGGGWYLARKGFGRQWRMRVVEELHKRGVEASIRRLTLDPFRGLVAQDVRIFRYRARASSPSSLRTASAAGSEREKPLAIVSEIALDINYAALFHHQPFLNALDIQNAQIILPLQGDEQKVERPLLKNLRAHIYFPPERISISQAEGELCGVRISAIGELIKRENYRPSTELSGEELEKRVRLLRQIVSELQKFTAPRTAPSLQVKFSGDRANLENAQVEATLRGEEVDRGSYGIRDLFATAEWRNQVLSVTRCGWTDNLGNLAARGNWSRERATGDFQVRSTVDLKGLAEAIGFGDRLSDVSFPSAPEIELRGDLDLNEQQPHLKIIGRARADRLAYKSVPFSDCGFEFSWDGERTLIRDIHLRQGSGELHAEILEAPNDFRLNIDSNIGLSFLRALASPETAQFLNEWEFPRANSIKLAIRGRDREPRNWQGDGSIALDQARFRGVLMKNATAKIHFADGAVTYQDFRVTRDEGVATGSFTYDFAKHEVRVANIKSSLRPTDAVFWIDPDLFKIVTPYRFRQPPTITANGVYQFHGGKGTHLDLTVDGHNGMDYTFLGKVLPFERISGKLVFTTDRLRITDLVGSLFGGGVRGSTDISLVHGDPRYHATLTVNKIDFPHLTDLYYNYKTAQGNLSGVYNFDGFGSDPRKMHGSGSVEVTQGDVFAIPVFGPLSGILGGIFGRLMPATGYSIAHRATANFKTKDGVIHTDDFEVAGNLFSLLGDGDIYFLDDKLDFDIRIEPKGPTVMLLPVYKLFEYKGEGSLKQPYWHPKGL